MNNNNIISKAKPQLIRRRTSVIHPQSVNIVVNAQKGQTVNLRDLKRVQPAPVIPIPKVAPPPPPVQRAAQQSAVSRNQLIKQRRNVARKTEVKYITTDPLPESAGRVASLHRTGRGKLLVIVGNGPSIVEASLERLSGHNKIDILTVNKPDSRIWPTKYWAFFDQSQFIRHEDLWNGFDGIVFNSTAIKRQKSSSMQFKNLGGKGWSRDLLTGLHIGRSSVFASMQIGAWMQHEHIYIFGCDMNPEGLNGQLHFYGKNPDVDPAIRKERFTKEAEFYDFAADMMSQEERAKFTFCSAYNPWPFVEKFNKLDHKEAIDLILNRAAHL